MPLTYQLAQAEQLPGAAYPENFTLAVHFPLPLPSPPSGEATAADALSEGASSGAVVEPVWSMDAVGVDVGIDSRGGRLLMSKGWAAFKPQRSRPAIMSRARHMARHSTAFFRFRIFL